MKRILQAVLLVAGILFLALSVREAAPYIREEGNRKRLREEVETDDTDEKGRQFRSFDWGRLKETNPDIIAWIEVPGTKIDYPVLEAKEWNEYLHKDYKRNRSILGAIFVQPGTSPDFSDPHTVIFGHNMRSRQMFGSLHSYEKKKFWEKHREVYLYQPGSVIISEIYSTYDCRDQSRTYQTAFRDLEDFLKWKEESIEKRYYDTGIEPEPYDRIITLSTCSNGRGRSSRYVVHAVVRKMIKI